ncbi:hypothetical protein JW979_10600 [bacterium]|nr:hypothetical protein [candidate division CSSED10-310 bacterium]
MNQSKTVKILAEIAILAVLVGVLVFLGTSYFRSNVPASSITYPGSWIRTPGPGGKEIRSLLWLDNEKMLLAGGRVGKDFDGIGVYSPQNIEWERPATGLELEQTVVDIKTVGDQIWSVFFANQSNPGGLLISEDHGLSWSQPITISGNIDPRCIEIISESKSTVLLGSVKEGIYRSEDYGKTWQRSDTGLKNFHIQCLCQDPFDISNILAGTIEGLYQSSDSGHTWKEIKNGLPTNTALTVDIEADPVNKGMFTALVRDKKGMSYVLQSSNSGGSWHQRMTGLPADVQVRSICYHPTVSNRIFIGTVHDGVYRSDNGGEQWSPMNTNLPITVNYIIVHALAFRTSPPERLYAGTDLDGSVWEYQFENY